MDWTTDNIPDQSGKTIIITGANIGLGYADAVALAAKGARVILACRNLDKAAAARANIIAAHPQADVRVEALDLTSFASIRAFAQRMNADLPHLDVLINNAGVMMTPKSLTADGFEMQFGTNHLGHFLLTGLLLPLLRKAPAARIVTVSSMAHRKGKIDFASFKAETEYKRPKAYGQSKLANLLFALELQRRLAKAGERIDSIAAHPGGANTNLAQHLGPLKYLSAFITQSADNGALPTLRAATDPAAKGGEYYGPAKMSGMYGPPVLETPVDTARDADLAARLWTVSEELVGLRYS